MSIRLINITAIFVNKFYKHMENNNLLNHLEKRVLNKSELTCENPKLLVRKDLHFIMEKAKYIVNPFGISPISLNNSTFRNHYKNGLIRELKFGNITLKNYQNYYAISEEGEHIDPFIVVGCGKCVSCQEVKRFSFAQMCDFETLSHSYLPWFGTLTYNEENLKYQVIYKQTYIADFAQQHSISYKDAESILSAPVNKDALKMRLEYDKEYIVSYAPSLCTRDVQLFLKRFRQNLKRKYNGKFNHSLRYAIVGEYGLTTHRPHYHFLFWNLHSSNTEEFIQIRGLIEHSWQNGFVQARVCQIGDKSASYTAKYVGKETDGYKSLRMSSKKDGGIGKPYLVKRYSSYLSKHLDASHLQYLVPNVGVKNVCFTSRVRKCLLPKFNEIVSSAVRSAVIDLSQYRFQCVDNMPCSCDMVALFKSFMFVPSERVADYSFTYQSIDECYYIIAQWLEKNGLSYSYGDIHLYLKQAFSTALLNETILITAFSNPVESKEVRQRRYRENHEKLIERMKNYESLYCNFD